MDDKSRITGLSQARVVSELFRQSFDVFTEFSGKSPFDLIAHKDGKLYRVQVKSTSAKKNKYGSWSIQLKKVRANKTENKIHLFDHTSCDILAVYIEEIDTVCFFDSKDLSHIGSGMNIREEFTPKANDSWIVKDHLIMK